MCVALFSKKKVAIKNADGKKLTSRREENQIQNIFSLLEKDIAYLDNAATTQKPLAVLDAVDNYYRTTNANVHRGIYKLAEESTEAYESARRTVAKYLHAKEEEIIFTSGTTHSMNLAARILENIVKPGDEILTTVAEHHSLFVPFQELAKRTRAKLVIVPLTNETITVDAINKYVTDKTRIIAISAASNVLGYTLDTKTIKKKQAVLVIDAAQAIRHQYIFHNVDFIGFSGHKIYGPMGIGVLYGKKELLMKGEPLLTGGSMIQNVTLEHTTWAETPQRYEAGTPNVAGAVGLAAALIFTDKNSKAFEKTEAELTVKAITIIKKYARIIGPTQENKERGPLISFVMEKVHAHDIAQILDQYGVCVRAGQHCCQPLHDSLGIEASVRVSIAGYNNETDIERLEEGLKKVREVFK